MRTQHTWTTPDRRGTVLARLVTEHEKAEYPPGTIIKVIIRRVVRVSGDNSYEDVRSEVFLRASGTLASAIQWGKMYYKIHFKNLK